MSDDDLEDLKVEIIEAKQLAVDENDRIFADLSYTTSDYDQALRSTLLQSALV